MKIIIIWNYLNRFHSIELLLSCVVFSKLWHKCSSETRGTWANGERFILAKKMAIIRGGTQMDVAARSVNASNPILNNASVPEEKNLTNEEKRKRYDAALRLFTSKAWQVGCP
jgi:hypothetical protein